MTRPIAAGPRVSLFAPSLRDEAEFLRRVAESGDLHRPWVSAPSSSATFAAYLDRLDEPTHTGFFLRAEDRLVGVVNINNIAMGALRSGHLGYYALSGGEGRGYMTEGLRLVIGHAFATLRLHRVEANIQPTNEASLRLARRLGLTKEGFSKRFLFVGGDWRDHERWALTVEDFVPRGV